MNTDELSVFTSLTPPETGKDKEIILFIVHLGSNFLKTHFCKRFIEGCYLLFVACFKQQTTNNKQIYKLHSIFVTDMQTQRRKDTVNVFESSTHCRIFSSLHQSSPL